MTELKILTQEEVGKKFDNPIMKNQVTGNQFVENKEGEIRLRGDFIGEKGYVSLEEVVQEAKKTGKRIILNLGDSSTSGWDSELITVNREIKKSKGAGFDEKRDIIFPLFNYRTYSDCLRDLVGEKFIIVNAGVPTHTALNGLRRFKEVVNQLAEQGLRVNYVTAYYGNNDSACNANMEEKDRHGLVGKVRSFFSRKKDQIITRTSEKDFKKYLKKIVSYAKKRGIKPILIEPETPLYWEPGRRVKRISAPDEEDEKIGGTEDKVKASYNLALDLWKKGNQAYQENNLKEALCWYEKAREKDYITPRIKEGHLQALRQVARETKTHLVRIEIPRGKGDGKEGSGYFGDYCHPLEKANRLYAQGIKQVIREKESDSPSKSTIPTGIYTFW